MSAILMPIYILQLVLARLYHHPRLYLSCYFRALIPKTVLLITSLCFLSPTVFALLSAATTNYIKGNSPRIKAELETELQNGDDVAFLDLEYKGQFLDVSLPMPDYTPQEIFDDFLSGEDSTLITPAAFLNDITVVESPYVQLDLSDKDRDTRIIFNIESTKGTIYNYNNGSPIPLTEAQMNQRFSQLASANIKPYLELESVAKVSTSFGAPSVQYYPDANIGITQGPMRRLLFNFINPKLLGATPIAGVVDWNGNNDAHWSKGWGFQQIDDLSKSFPTTGFNGASFKLRMTGASSFDVSNPELNWKVIKTPSSSNITATVSVQDSSYLIVSLTGPSSGDTNGLGPVAFNGPVTFEVTDDLGALSYKFRITKWFIPKHFGVSTAVVDALNYCSTINGYHAVTRAELSNSTHSNATVYPPYNPITGANNGTNPSPAAEPQATSIGYAIGPVFSEWSMPVYGQNRYPDSDFNYNSSFNEFFITREQYSSTQYYWINSNGAVSISQPYGLFTKFVVCAS